MNSLMHYGSDDENSNDSKDGEMGVYVGRCSSNVGSSDAIYDSVPMDMSEESNNINSSDDSERSLAGCWISHSQKGYSLKSTCSTSDQRRTDHVGCSNYRKENKRDNQLNESQEDRQEKNYKHSSDEKNDNKKGGNDHKDINNSNKHKDDNKKSRDEDKKSKDDEKKSRDDGKKSRGNVKRKEKSSKEERNDDKSKRDHKRDRDKKDNRDRRRVRDGDKDRDKEKEKKWDRTKGRNRDKSRGRSRDVSRDRGRHRRRSRDGRSKDHNKDRRHSRDNEHTRSRSRSRDRTSRSRIRKERNKFKIAQLEKLGIEIKASDVDLQKISTQRSFYNPLLTATQGKYAEQIQKRKLLWANKKPYDTNCTTTSSTNAWVDATFTHDQDGKVTAKFKRLMGIKGELPDTIPEAKPDILKKQEEMFNNMEHQYEVARATTHTQRGVGFGYASGLTFPR